MEALTKKSKRLSSLLSLNSSNHEEHPPSVPPFPPQSSNVSPVPSNSTMSLNGKLRKSSHDKTNGVNFSYPNYSPPTSDYKPVQPPSQPSSARQSLGPLDTASSTLLPPPRVFSEQGSFSAGASPASSRPSSRTGSRPPTAGGLTPQSAYPASESSGSKLKREKRKSSWFGGSKESKVVSKGGNKSRAWVAGHDERIEYNLDPLLQGKQVEELWEPDGDTDVYLFAKDSNKGPSFRIHAYHYSQSPLLTRLAHGRLYSASMAPEQRYSETRRKPVESGIRHLSLSSTGSPMTQSPELRPLDFESSSSGSRRSRPFTDSDHSGPTRSHLYLPLGLTTDTVPMTSDGQEARLTSDDIEKLVAIRNLIAFLVGQSLVATERKPGIFAIFIKISDLLSHYEFSDFGSTTYGEVAAASFELYVRELELANIKMSREKTIEAIVLGERMRSRTLYTEGFVHGVGRWDDIKTLKSPKITLMTAKTQKRLERASLDLEQRQRNVNSRLHNFEFPAIFSGIMNSKTSSERKQVRFEAWKTAFMGMRKWVLSYYKHKYGAWPPKASSKKNSLETSGLNRLVLTELYKDMCALYDVLVDRTSLTTRTMDAFGNEDDIQGDSDANVIGRALRKVLDEYDRAQPPVQPPIPFDLPRLPSLSTVRQTFTTASAKEAAKLRAKKLKPEEQRTVLQSTHNQDSIDPRVIVQLSDTDSDDDDSIDVDAVRRKIAEEEARARREFLNGFFDSEARLATGKTIDEILDLRVGQWIFLYAVLNSLPMLVTDAHDLQYTPRYILKDKQNVDPEYFLCMNPPSALPWTKDSDGPSRGYYRVAGSSGFVSLPTDVVENGVDGTYRRSHAWKQADKWSEEGSGLMKAAVKEILEDPSGVQRQASMIRKPAAGAAALDPGATAAAAGLMPPPVLGGAGEPMLRPRRAESPYRGQRQSVMMQGLEALPVPVGVNPTGAPTSRPSSSHNTGKTFDDILGAPAPTGKKSKKK